MVHIRACPAPCTTSPAIREMGLPGTGELSLPLGLQGRERCSCSPTAAIPRSSRTEQLDAQIGYTFPDSSALKGLGVLLQVNNLTDSPYRTRLGLDTAAPTPPAARRCPRPMRNTAGSSCWGSTTASDFLPVDPPGVRGGARSWPAPPFLSRGRARPPSERVTR